ncbi:pyruvate-formate lyase-activating enzyme [Paenibacillus profundus]|uniref:Pyruvate-formate lyase-activating enzyme n=1 Tax=Paenibacillus profundus TaxID=1173085 RepID=A0ABS8YDD4_9BACL|nr:pyruvate-formate lyase-activating enzyme [Paenibacillus profundus]MCE5168505.1 pyruvate-formate lyase-activating enzyme [Paenibacillus profundus]
MAITQAQTDTRELLNFIGKISKRDTEEYQGKYHHLGFNWREYSLKSDALSRAIVTALQGFDEEERHDCYAQIIYRILDNDDALERFLDAAFGGGIGRE